MARKRIGELLLEKGLISPLQLEAGLVAQRQTRQRLGAVLLAQGALSEPALAQALGELLELPVVGLAARPPDWSAIHLLRARFCEQHGLFPLALENGAEGRRQLVVAMVDPLDTAAVQEIEFTTGLKVVRQVATSSEVRAAILRHYHKTAPGPGPSRVERPRPAAPTRVPQPVGTGEEKEKLGEELVEELVIIGEELPAADEPQRQALTELIQQREEAWRKRRGRTARAPESEAPTASLSAELDALIGGLDEPLEPTLEPMDPVEELERKFWALMRIMARKGLLTKEEFTRELDDDGGG